MALVDAQMVATMKRIVTPRRVRFSLSPYDGRPLGSAELAALEDAAARYGSFLGADAELTVTQARGHESTREWTPRGD